MSFQTISDFLFFLFQLHHESSYVTELSKYLEVRDKITKNSFVILSFFN